MTTNHERIDELTALAPDRGSSQLARAEAAKAYAMLEVADAIRDLAAAIGDLDA